MEWALSTQSSDLIARLREGDDQLFRELYQQYRQEFVEWATGNARLDEDEAVDIFQEAITSLYLNVYSGKLQCLEASLKTYIFAIGRNHIRKRYHAQRDLELHGSPPECVDEPINVMDTKYFSDDQAIKAASFVGQMPEPCKSIIQFFYLRNFSMEVIAERLGYKNVKVLKAKKWRCLKQIRNKLGLQQRP